MSRLHNRVTLYFYLAVICAVGLAGGLYFWQGLGLIASWIIAVSVVEFALFGVDKGFAGKPGRVRLPEALLHFMALAGGTLGAFGGAFLFRHKVSKRSFMVRLYIIAIVQAVVAAGVLYRSMKI